MPIKIENVLGASQRRIGGNSSRASQRRIVRGEREIVASGFLDRFVSHNRPICEGERRRFGFEPHNCPNCEGERSFDAYEPHFLFIKKGAKTTIKTETFCTQQITTIRTI